MSRFFEELAYCETRLGPLSLRRKEILELENLEVFEVTLGDEFLMSSLFHDAEVALARLGLEAASGEGLDVVVGGLGLGYTAVASLKEPRLASLVVIDALQEVIDWHLAGMVPLGEILVADERCKLVCADFFAQVASAERALDPDSPGKLWDAVLLDIDHSPQALLHEGHGSFYSRGGLAGMAHHLKPGGVFAMWSDGQPLGEFIEVLESSFADVHAEVISFNNPLQGRRSGEMEYGMVGGEEPSLEKYMGEVAWDYLKPHFDSGALLFVDPSLDLKSVAEALVGDEKAQVEAWLKSGDLLKPSEPHAAHWAASGERFRAVVVSPFVLMQPAGAE
jgi:spermidine synthase